jgi:hypothetical protein
MKSFLVPIMLASSLISTAAVASELQVLQSNDKPISCIMSIKSKASGNCGSFKLLKEDKLYIFSFLFKEGSFGFVAIPFKSDKDTNTFLAAKVYYKGKFHVLKNPGVCVASKKYEFIQCSANDLAIDYRR